MASVTLLPPTDEAVVLRDPVPAYGAAAAVLRLARRLVRGSVPVLLHMDAAGLRLECLDGAPALPLELAHELCRAALYAEAPVTISNTRSELEAGAGLEEEPHAFAGVPVVGASARPIGALALLQPGARAWTVEEVGALTELAAALASELERDEAETEAERLAQDLAVANARYRRLLATCPLGIYFLEPTGRIVVENRALLEILGRDLGSVIGMDFRELIAPESMEIAVAAVRDALRGPQGPQPDLDIYVLRPSGERRLVRIARAPVLQGSRVVGLQGVVRDITEERVREMQMRRGERMASIAPLLSGICHELNNPLTSIQSFAELLLLDERPAADREALEIMQREAHRAAAIVSDLRVVARRSQEVGSSRGLVDLNEVVETAVREHRDALGAVGAHVDCDLTPDLPAAWAVRAQIAQVVGHLLSNAEQAVRDASAERRITLRTFRSEHGVALAVTDTGPGIGPEHHDRIFDPFWTTRQAGEGAGLGLSLVHSIVADHDGRIRLDSAPGLGATFTIDLPFAERAPVAEGECDGDSAASRGLRVLVVDDEAAIRVSLIRYLQRRGHRVAEASEGGAALRLLDEASERPAFDVIIADLRMPGLGGDALLERLRERNEGLEQRVVFITGDADGPDAAALLQDPSIPVIWKPFELAEVTQVAEAQAGLAG